MAAATDRIAVPRGWPQWIVSVAERSPTEVPGFFRAQLDQRGPARSFNLFCSTEGPQPIYACAGNHAVVFEGNLYNASDLATRLEISERASDVAFVLIRAYERWSEDFISKLRGVFGLVLWDRTRDVLIAGRDPIGIYPMYFARGGDELMLSTSADALMKHPQVSRRINRAAVVDYLTDYWPRLQETFYEAVKRIPPGSMMRSRAGSESVERYWNPKIAEKESDWVDENDAARFDQLLTAAVDRSLQAGQAGIFLSGGLDSVGVAAVAADLAAARGLPPPQALSLAFRNSEADEEDRQRAVARQLGLPQLVVPYQDPSNSEGSLRPVFDLNRVSSFPLMNPWLPRYNYLAERGKELGCRTILTGSGGDEWFGISPFLAGDLLRSLDLVAFNRLRRVTHRSFKQSPFKQAWELAWRFGVRPMIRAEVVQRLQRMSPGTLAAVRRRKFRKSLPSWLALDSKLFGQTLDRFATSETFVARESGAYGLYFAESKVTLDHPIVSWELEEWFENCRRINITYSHPYYDLELVELLWRTAPSVLTRGGYSKGLLRESVARRFPGLGFEKQKKVEVCDLFVSNVRREGPVIWKELGGAKALEKLGIVDSARVNGALQGMLASRTNIHPDASKAFALMNLEYWLRPRI
jgi:asparagine synthetase B (glutamine-hydrolysing)